MNNNRFKLFLDNFAFYGGISIIGKSFPIIMLPIITRLLPDSSNYGIADLTIIISSFGIQIAVLGMYDAMFREYFEFSDRLNRKKITSTAFCFVLLFSILLMVLFISSRILFSQVLFGDIKFQSMIVLSAVIVFAGSIGTIVQAPTRIRNQKKIFLISGITSPIINYSLVIIFIKLGYKFEALIYAHLITNLCTTLFFLIINKDDFIPILFDLSVLKELLRIGLPLVPTFIIYWVFNSIDRIMITKMIGISELGIYSIGSRLASISMLVQAAFSGGWQFFSFTTMKDNDQVSLNSKIFEYLGIISYILFMVSIPFISVVFNFLFEGDYTRGQEVFPYLFLSPLLLILYQTIANQFVIIKKTILSTLSLLVGGIINILLNIVLIKLYGIKGAALATLISYFVSVIIAILIAKVYKLEKIQLRFYIISFLMFFIIFFIFSNKSLCMYIFSFINIFCIFVLYAKDFKNIFSKN